MSDDEALRTELEQLEARRVAAILAGDMAAHAELLADDLVYVHSTGTVDTKAQLLEMGAKSRIDSLNRGPLLIRRAGPDAAVMTGTISIEITPQGAAEPMVIGMYMTEVWTRSQGKWRVGTVHCTRLQ